jgi:hypothetical protein
MIGATTASALLAKYADLFRQARHGELRGKQFVGQGHKLYDVTETLQGAERELRQYGNDLVYGNDPAWIDLQNIVVQLRDWQAEEAETPAIVPVPVCPPVR